MKAVDKTSQFRRDLSAALLFSFGSGDQVFCQILQESPVASFFGIGQGRFGYWFTKAQMIKLFGFGI
jgi:hypothetical protein